MFKIIEPDKVVIGEIINKGNVLEFQETDDSLNDYIVEILRTEGANDNYISYIRSEIEELKTGDSYKIEYNGEEICTVFLV